ncbi:putative acyl-CoA dehydrogenase AidB [compost metagenome]
MPRLFRQSPLNAIWEGSGNVIALDVLRAVGREPEAVEALRGFLEAARGRDSAYDGWLDGLDFAPSSEGAARLSIERLALAAQAAVLLMNESPVAGAFCRLRLASRGAAYGAFDVEVDTRAILDRASPA